MSQIEVSFHGDRLVLKFQADDSTQCTIEFPREDAQRLSLALTGAVRDEDPLPESLFAAAPAIATLNPRFELQRSDIGQIFIAYEPAGFRPFVIQFDEDRARALQEALADALRS